MRAKRSSERHSVLSASELREQRVVDGGRCSRRHSNVTHESLLSCISPPTLVPLGRRLKQRQRFARGCMAPCVAMRRRQMKLRNALTAAVAMGALGLVLVSAAEDAQADDATG